MDNAQSLENKHHVQVYNRFPATLDRGLGARVWDTNGTEYIDALGGIAVANLGHSHPNIIEAIKKQSEKLLHTSNFFYTEPQSNLAKKLADLSGLDRVFFGNSGLEAMEAALKLARKWGNQQGKTGNIISLENGFHGRAITSVTMGSKKLQEGFWPLPDGFEQSPYNDFEALASKVDTNTIAIVFELVQGNSGVNMADKEFVQKVRDLCDDLNVLLIFDEIQTGVGRTGKFWAFEHYGIKPDILTSAKGLAGGIPISAMIAKENVASAFGMGSHGTTFGGNPFACAVANACIDTILSDNILERTRENGQYFMDKLREVAKENPEIKEVRGLGLIIGVQLDKPSRPVVDRMFQNKVIANAAAGNVIRLVPPLVITKEEIDIVVETLVKSL